VRFGTCEALLLLARPLNLALPALQRLQEGRVSVVAARLRELAPLLLPPRALGRERQKGGRRGAMLPARARRGCEVFQERS
jgi:hypothetical protein